MQEKIIILDFGSQYTQLIARRIREMQVYCEIHPFNRMPELDSSVRGVILSGSPSSVRDDQAPRIDLDSIKGRLPLLGICYGAQYLAHFFGGRVEASASREYGRSQMSVVEPDDELMQSLSPRSQVWMSHGDTITSIPDAYRIVASTDDVAIAAYRIDGEQTWGIQFHPEVYHSTEGKTLLENFVVGICGCSQSWTSESFVETTVRELREKLGGDKVVLGHMQACTVARCHLEGALGGGHAALCRAQAGVPADVGGVERGAVTGCEAVDDVLILGMDHHPAGLLGKDAAQHRVVAQQHAAGAGAHEYLDCRHEREVGRAQLADIVGGGAHHEGIVGGRCGLGALHLGLPVGAGDGGGLGIGHVDVGGDAAEQGGAAL